jgi:hypothetical protein
LDHTNGGNDVEAVLCRGLTYTYTDGTGVVPIDVDDYTGTDIVFTLRGSEDGDSWTGCESSKAKPLINTDSAMWVQVDNVNIATVNITNIEVSGGCYPPYPNNSNVILIRSAKYITIDGLDGDGHKGVEGPCNEVYRQGAYLRLDSHNNIEMLEIELKNMTLDDWGPNTNPSTSYGDMGTIQVTWDSDYAGTPTWFKFHDNNMSRSQSDLMQMVDGEFQSWTNGVLIYDNVFDRGAENNLDFKATDYVSIYNNTFKRQNWDHHGATEMVQSLIQFFRPYDFDECGGYCHHDYPHHYRIYENIFEINHGETGSQEYGSAISFNNASNVDIRNNEIIDCFPAIRATLTSDTDGDYIVTQNNHIRSDKSPDKARDDTCDSANGGDRKCSAILYNSAYFGSNSAILNNSIYFTGAKAFYGIYLHSSVDDILNIKNNIVQLDTAANSYPLYIQGAGIDQTGIDYNTHYNDNSGTKAVWDRTAEVDTKGTNDKNRLPKFTSISDLRLQADSSETNTGTDAGTTTDDCVADITAACVNDPTSSWPDAVVYMDQDDYGSSWTRGAFGNPCTPSPPSITDPTPSETEVPLNRTLQTKSPGLPRYLKTVSFIFELDIPMLTVTPPGAPRCILKPLEAFLQKVIWWHWWMGIVILFNTVFSRVRARK